MLDIFLKDFFGLFLALNDLHFELILNREIKILQEDFDLGLEMVMFYHYKDHFLLIDLKMIDQMGSKHSFESMVIGQDLKNSFVNKEKLHIDFQILDTYFYIKLLFKSVY